MAPAKAQGGKPAIRFMAALSRPAKATQWTTVALPRGASAALPSRGEAMAEGMLNGFPFRAVVGKDAKGLHSLRIGNATRDAAGASVGETVAVELMRIGDEPEARVPADLRKAIAAVPRAQATWRDTTPIARRDWILWMSSTRQPQTRRRRIEKACDMLASGKRQVCCFGGIHWLMKDLPKQERWSPLPGAKRSPPSRTAA